jgi:hypothetical protein
VITDCQRVVDPLVYLCHACQVRIPTKLVLGLATASAVILGSYGWRELRKEKKDLTDVAKHDMKVLGTALKVAIENALRDQQVADVTEILTSLKLKDSAIDVLVFDPAGQLSPHSFRKSQFGRGRA